MRIDLHTHSSASDGTEPPAVVVAQAARAGLDVVALTDHDTTAGWDEAAAAAREHGVALVRGAEVSARSTGMSVHVLSYLHDPAHPGLAAELERARDA
ncbi:MAG: PHP domain-containing protein, partial [Actinomycetales bacterium]|nr:PHP domain-containing protein [Actinomycetales bacterium]